MRNFFHRSGSGRKACGGHRTYLQVERLDDRTVPSTFTVTNLNDSGAGSLRAAIAAANRHPDRDTIDFDPAVRGTIALASPLPDLTTDINLNGPGANLLAVRRDTGGNYGIFSVGSGATVALSGLTISNSNGYIYRGGGINNAGSLTLNSATISDNSAMFGGGLYNSGTATITACTFTGNYASWSGSAVYNIFGTLTLNDSTISGNVQYTPPPDDWGGFGSIGAEFPSLTIITNSTIAGNTGGFGGIFIDWSTGNAELRVGNTILASNTALVSNTAGNVAGVIVSLGHNLSDKPAWSGGSGYAATDLVGTSAQPIDPQLGPLQYNGGPTPTMALFPSSPAIDAGDNANAPATDQRGLPRILDGNQDGTPTIDIGAYEYQITNTPDTQAPTAPGNLTATVAGTSQINLSWTASTDNVGVTGYRVERQGPGDQTFRQVATVTGTTYSDTGLKAGSTYSYRVRATDAAGNLSPYSNVARATTNRRRQNYTATSIGNAELHVRNTIITGNGYDLSGDLGSWGHNLIGNPTIGSGFAATDLLNVDPKPYPLQDNGGPRSPTP